MNNDDKNEMRRKAKKLFEHILWIYEQMHLEYDGRH
jgi:hypothetical protein